MALISKPNTYVAGNTIVAADQNSNEDTLYNEINGQLDNANIKSGAGIVDTKLAQITTASKVSGAAITLMTSVPSGAGELPIANIPSIDEDDMSSNSDTQVPTQQSVKAYTDTIMDIEDYGTSLTTGSSVDAVDTIIAHGNAAVSGSSSVSISNLNFTSATSYTFVACFGLATTAIEALIVVQNSGSSVTITSTDNLAQTVRWIAIGT